MTGLAIVSVFVLVALFGPAFAPYDPFEANLAKRLQSPSAEHILGTDALGRDLLSRLIEASRPSLAIGLLVSLIAASLGVPVGLVAGYVGGPLDHLLMRLIDVLLALPGVILAIGIVAALGPGFTNVMIALGVVTIPAFARLVRGTTLSTKEMLFVEAARASGAGALRIMRRHVLPNVASPVMVLFAFRVAAGLLSGASLGFLGLGIQPPDAEWGAMLSDGRLYIRTAPHIVLLPGAAIIVFILGINLFADALRDILDPLAEKHDRSAI